MCTSSISSSSPSVVSPNSYFVSARISPLRAPRSRAAFEQRQCDGLHPFPQLRIDEPARRRRRRTTAARRAPPCSPLVVGVTIGVSRREFLVSPSGSRARTPRVRRRRTASTDAVSVTPVMYPRTTTSTVSGIGAAGDQHVRVGNRDEVVGDDVAWSRSNHHADSWLSTWPLNGHAGDDPVEGGEPVGGDEQPVPVRERVRHADLAVAPIVERQVDVVEGEPVSRTSASRSSAWLDAVREELQAQVVRRPLPHPARRRLARRWSGC